MLTATDFILGEWKISPSRNRLVHRRGEEVHLEPKPMLVLARLAAAGGAVVTRDEILGSVWPDEFVTEDVLSRCISLLRKALRDDPRAPLYIETIRKGGYRLIPAIEPAPERWPESVGRAVAASPRVAAQLWLSAGAVLLLTLSLGSAMHVTGRERRFESPRFLPLTSFRGSELDPVLSPDGKRLAFSWSGDADENFDIYVKTLGTEELVRITSHPGEDKNPAWSPDGSELAFVRSAAGANGIHLAPASGGSERRLLDTVSGDIPDLVWSPDGAFLYFPDRDEAGEASGIFRLDLASLRRERLTNPGSGIYGDRDLALSPDGSRIAFARAVAPDLENLWVAHADGGSARRITEVSHSINGIAWSAGGDSILYSTPRDGSSRLWAIGRDGGAPRALAAFGDGVFDPSISSDGTRVVFERKAYDTNVWRFELPVSSGPVAVIDSTRWDSMPAISPDGSRIAFISDRTGGAAVWLSDPDGSDPRRLTEGTLPASSGPQWSPDGRSIVVALRRDGTSKLFRIDAKTGGLERLTNGAGDDVEPVFSADGRTILFSSNRTGRWEIFRILLDGNAPVAAQVTRSGAYRCHESSDGRLVYFARPGRSGLWAIAADGGDESLVFATPEWSSPHDWDVAPSGIYFVAASQNAAEARRIVRFDLAKRELEAVSPPLRGINIPNLGLSVAPDETWLLLGRVDRADGDIVAADTTGKRPGFFRKF